jgi:hypothetical protein
VLLVSDSGGVGREREVTVFHVELHDEFRKQVLTVLAPKHLVAHVTFETDGYMTISDLIPNAMNKNIILAAEIWNEAIGVAREKLQKVVMELGKE